MVNEFNLTKGVQPKLNSHKGLTDYLVYILIKIITSALYNVFYNLFSWGEKQNKKWYGTRGQNRRLLTILHTKPYFHLDKASSTANNM